MSYKSPIEIMINEMENQIVERDNKIVCQISQQYGINVDKEELEKALIYDRNQYEKGFADAKKIYEKALDKACKELYIKDQDNDTTDFMKQYKVWNEEQWKEWALKDE